LEDLSKKLTDLLSSPEGLEQIKNVASMLSSGFGGSSDTPQPTSDSSSGSSQEGSSNFDDFINPQTIMNLKEAYESMNNVNDNNINLLLALKPHMSDKRKSKIELAVKLIRLSKLRGVLGDFLK
jgi:hypothetical protein